MSLVDIERGRKKICGQRSYPRFYPSNMFSLSFLRFFLKIVRDARRARDADLEKIDRLFRRIWY